MPYNPKSLNNLKPFSKGHVSNSPRRGRPKGSKNFSTMVKESLDSRKLLDLVTNDKKLGRDLEWIRELDCQSGVEAIITAVMIEAMQGNIRAAAWLKDQGWGKEIVVEEPEERKIVIRTFATANDENVDEYINRRQYTQNT